jgi:hypothetical protein
VDGHEDVSDSARDAAVDVARAQLQLRHVLASPARSPHQRAVLQSAMTAVEGAVVRRRFLVDLAGSAVPPTPELVVVDESGFDD